MRVQNVRVAQRSDRHEGGVCFNFAYSDYVTAARSKYLESVCLFTLPEDMQTSLRQPNPTIIELEGKVATWSLGSFCTPNNHQSDHQFKGFFFKHISKLVFICTGQNGLVSVHADPLTHLQVWLRTLFLMAGSQISVRA